MWILIVKFNASTWNFLSLVILSAIFNVSVLGFSMYFCLKNNKDLFIYLFFISFLFIYFYLFYLFIYFIYDYLTPSDKSVVCYRPFLVSSRNAPPH